MTTTSDPNPMTTQRGAAPLTTVFATPDFCNSLYWTNTITPPLSSVVCMPTSWHQVNDYSWGYYSPGICPSGYTEGCAFPTSLATSKDGAVGMGGPVTVGETPRLCCPTGYVCYTDTKSYGYSKCISTIPTTSFYNSDNQPTSQLALVYAVQVRWASSDLSILETDPTVPGATYTGATATGSGGETVATTGAQTGSNSIATATATSTPAGSDTGSSDGGGGGISVGTTIAIAVGSVAGTLVLALLAFILLWRRRKRRHAQKIAAAGENGGSADSDSKSDSVAPTMAHKAPVGKSSLDIMSPSTARPGTGTTVVGDEALHSLRSPTTTAQLDSTTVMEMETMERPQELPDTNEVFEMEGDMPGPPLYREKEGWPLR
ncbi:uncharacterized protein CLUP02_04883 [Colletotrichum lupini]|uniref:Uncharacterized protein n=1 Tax=Colletotrichum lupini TaxID=145971 RepID=A0A9Q8WDJ2_9PEZI|nr:uncharacterized protein CLUP02_04883 [Colletotrichum lupini]KAK1709536.1 hypothetical protein BDP67DRAFT_408886 [Colletotrichum lupini]UQC79404.1 hypothetical protein CLUP02_04883 [Colletotrichum lupini]